MSAFDRLRLGRSIAERQLTFASPSSPLRFYLIFSSCTSLPGYGVMGGFMQPQGHVQILLNMLHHGANAQSTLDAPRFCISADVPKDKAAGDIGTLVYLEEGVKPEVVEQLKKMGHDVELLSGHARSQFGRGQASTEPIPLLLYCTDLSFP